MLAARDSWALLDEWVPQPRRLERDEALEEFAFRYFSSHGPATVKDFAWWSSLTLTDARAGLAAARDRLDELEVDGATYYLRPGLEPAERAVHLLPGFDEYLLGYGDRSAPLAGEHADHDRARRQRDVHADDRRRRRGRRHLEAGAQRRSAPW